LSNLISEISRKSPL